MCFKSILSKINELEKRLSSSIHELHSAFYVCLILKGLLPERIADVEDNVEGSSAFLLLAHFRYLFCMSHLCHERCLTSLFLEISGNPQVLLIILNSLNSFKILNSLNSFKSFRGEMRAKIMTFSFLRRKEFQNPENTMYIPELLNFIREHGK